MLVATVSRRRRRALRPVRQRQRQAQPAEQEAGKARTRKPKQPFPGDRAISSRSPPIVTNLAGPKGTWIRLEAASWWTERGQGGQPCSPAQITEDIVAYLRTVPLAQIEGASGFQHLREDLNDRVRMRSDGKVRELVIQSLIVE